MRRSYIYNENPYTGRDSLNIETWSCLSVAYSTAHTILSLYTMYVSCRMYKTGKYWHFKTPYSEIASPNNCFSQSSQYNYQTIGAQIAGSGARSCFTGAFLDNKVHEANMGPTWVLSAPDGPQVGPMNLAIRVVYDPPEGTFLKEFFWPCKLDDPCHICWLRYRSRSIDCGCLLMVSCN